jgi:hypothetical protein
MGLDIFFALIQEKILSKLLLQDDVLQDFALRRRLNEYMIPNNLERSVAFQQNPYQQNPYQPNVNKNQFIPPHFKQEVYKEVKKMLEDGYSKNNAVIMFGIIKIDLDQYIEDETNGATGPNMLNPFMVAQEFYQDYVTAYEDDDEESQQNEENIAVASSAPPPPSSVGAPSSVGTPSSAAAASTPSSAAAASTPSSAAAAYPPSSAAAAFPSSSAAAAPHPSSAAAPPPLGSPYSPFSPLRPRPSPRKK